MSEFSPENRSFRQSDFNGLGNLDAISNQDAMTPSISIDRTLSHIAGNIGVDMQAIQEFYYGLPHDNKVDLDKLHIHFSAARPEDNLTETLSSGDFSRYGTKVLSRRLRRITPELEPTEIPTIRIFVGSAMLELYEGQEFDKRECTILSKVVSSSVAETLAHELTHFAQTTDAELVLPARKEIIKANAKTDLLKILLGVIRNKRDIGVGIGVAGLSEILMDGGSNSLLTGIGAVALSHLANRKDRKTLRAEKDFERYKDKEHEVDAREHEDKQPDLCTITLLEDRVFPKGYKLEDIVKQERDRLGSSVANDKHRDLAYTPRGLEPKAVRKAALKNEMRAIGVRSEIQKTKRQAFFSRAFNTKP